MSRPEAITERDLHAYVDGALDAAERGRIEAWLGEHPEDAAKVAAYVAQNQALHTAFDPVLGEAVPERLIEATGPRSGGLSSRPTWQRLAAALVLVAVGVGSGWFARDFTVSRQAPYRDLAYESLSAHRVYAVEVRHPVEVTADQEQHLVTWLTKRIGAPIHAPDLKAIGYHLVGGRLLPAQGKPAAQLMYESAHGDRVTIYLRANTTNALTAFRFDQADDLSAFYWLEKDLAYAIVAQLPREELYRVADVIYDQLEEDH